MVKCDLLLLVDIYIYVLWCFYWTYIYIYASYVHLNLNARCVMLLPTFKKIIKFQPCLKVIKIWFEFACKNSF
jgi:hypothetical protein